MPSRRKNLSASTELTKEDRTLAAASSVTSALRQTQTLLASELSRSQFAHDTLKESTLALKELGETYSTLDTMLSKSRTLVGTLLKSNKSDTWYLESAFYLLCATIAWLVFRRFIYGPAWWLVWIPLKLFYKAWMGVFVALGIRSSRDGVLAGDFGGGDVDVGVIGTGTVSPSVAGSDAPVIGTGQDSAREEEGMIEEVGKIVDESKQAEGSDYFATKEEQDPENPQKRMWEEEKEAKKAEQRRKDEL
jgi:protein transport protein SEC20